jgi:hypothetical protein
MDSVALNFVEASPGQEALMPDDREARIRERAHVIWEEEGRPVGKEREHWERAAKDVDAQGQSPDSGAEADKPDILKDTTAVR